MASSTIYFGQVASLLLAWITNANESWTLSIENYTDPFIFQAGRPSDIKFSLVNISQNETVYVGLSKGGVFIFNPLCFLTISAEKCMTNNDTCVCVKLEQSGHHYLLKKTFTENDSGQWFFYFLGNFKARNVGFNITMKTTKQTSATTEKGQEHPPSGLTTEGTSFSYDVTERDSTDEADKELDEECDGLIPSYLTCCQHTG